MFFRSASFCASSVMNLSASLPVPPYGVNTRGLKEPCSISITRWLYIRFFSFSLLLKAVSSFWFRWLFANGLNTLTSKNAFCPYCIVLYCIVSYCTVLYCIVLYCIVLYCIVLYCIVLYCIVLYCNVLLEPLNCFCMCTVGGHQYRT